MAPARRRNHWVDHIARHAHTKPDAVYLRFEGRSTTWSQLEQRVTTVAAAMTRRGVGAGDRVAIMMTNRPEFLETMFAANALARSPCRSTSGSAPARSPSFLLTAVPHRLRRCHSAAGAHRRDDGAAAQRQLQRLGDPGADGGRTDHEHVPRPRAVATALRRPVPAAPRPVRLAHGVLGRGAGHHDAAGPDGRGVLRGHQRRRVRSDGDVAGDLRAGRRRRAAEDRFGAAPGSPATSCPPSCTSWPRCHATPAARSSRPSCATASRVRPPVDG